MPEAMLVEELMKVLDPDTMQQPAQEWDLSLN